LDSLFNKLSERDKKKFEIYFRPIYETSCFKIVNLNKNNLEDFYLYAKENNFKILPKTNMGISYFEADKGENTFVINPDLKI